MAYPSALTCQDLTAAALETLPVIVALLVLFVNSLMTILIESQPLWPNVAVSGRRPDGTFQVHSKPQPGGDAVARVVGRLFNRAWPLLAFTHRRTPSVLLYCFGMKSNFTY